MSKRGNLLTKDWFFFDEEGIYIERLTCRKCGSEDAIEYRREKGSPHITGYCVNCGCFVDYSKQLNDERWRQLVKERARYTCERCGQALDTYHVKAHHLLPVWFMPERSLDPYNGVCLCTTCHKQIHGAGGTIKNEQ